MMARSAEPDHGFTCFWRITNFDLTSTSSNYSFESESFKIPMLSSSSWHLELEHKWRDSLRLYLYKEDGNKGNSNVDIQISVLTSSGWRTRFRDFFKFKPGGTGYGTTLLVDWKKMFSRNKHVVDGCLTVSCHISNGATWGKYEQCFLVSNMASGSHLPVVLQFNDLEHKHLVNFPTPTVELTGSALNTIANVLARNIQYNERISGCPSKEGETKSTQTESTEENDVLCDSEDILKLFRDKGFQYVTLRTPLKDFAVHKALLCARSPVFNDMLQRKKEGNAILEIEDVDSDTLSLLLQYFHMESPINSPINDLEWDAVLRLYNAADKYQIAQLKKYRRSYLKKNSSEENVCDPSILEDMEQESELQETVEESIADAREVTSYGSWCF